MGINKSNYIDAKKLIHDIDMLENTLKSIDRDRNAKKSEIIINLQAHTGANGWPSTYRIPVEQNYRIYECLHELFQNIVYDKYKELNSL